MQTHKQQRNRNRVLEKRKHELSTSRTLLRLFVLDYKKARQRRRVVRIQSALCEVECEQNSRGLKIAVVKGTTVFSA